MVPGCSPPGVHLGNSQALCLPVQEFWRPLGPRATPRVPPGEGDGPLATLLAEHAGLLLRLQHDVGWAAEHDPHHGRAREKDRMCVACLSAVLQPILTSSTAAPPSPPCRIGDLGEAKMYGQMQRLGVYFVDEKTQRALLQDQASQGQGQGHGMPCCNGRSPHPQQLPTMGIKTPDAKLPVPILVRGRLVHWVDSKADFGSEFMHRRNLSGQLAKYVSRFGSGMVIYW